MDMKTGQYSSIPLPSLWLEVSTFIPLLNEDALLATVLYVPCCEQIPEKNIDVRGRANGRKLFLRPFSCGGHLFYWCLKGCTACETHCAGGGPEYRQIFLPMLAGGRKCLTCDGYKRLGMQFLVVHCQKKKLNLSKYLLRCQSENESLFNLSKII